MPGDLPPGAGRRARRRCRRRDRCDVFTQDGNDRPGIHSVLRAERTAQRGHFAPVSFGACAAPRGNVRRGLGVGCAHDLELFWFCGLSSWLAVRVWLGLRQEQAAGVLWQRLRSGAGSGADRRTRKAACGSLASRLAPRSALRSPPPAAGVSASSSKSGRVARWRSRSAGGPSRREVAGV